MNRRALIKNSLVAGAALALPSLPAKLAAQPKDGRTNLQIGGGIHYRLLQKTAAATYANTLQGSKWAAKRGTSHLHVPGAPILTYSPRIPVRLCWAHPSDLSLATM